MPTRLLLALFVCSAIACGGGDDSPTAPTEVTGSAPFSTADLVIGSGAEAALGQRITVHYTLWLYSDTASENKGRQVQSTLGGAPAALTLASGSVIGGWVQGVPGMRVGGRRRIVVPPELGYGAAGTTGIPPNATLLFEVELVGVS